LGKVWNGPEGFYVDDNNLHVEEFLFRFNGPLRKYRFDIVVPFFNEENNVNKVYENLTKANRLIRVNRLVFVNNGSTDGTANALMKLSKKDSRVRVIEVRKNKGYGHGMKVGMKECTSDYIITTHGDNQFKLYEYLLINMDNIVRDFSDGSSIFSIRGGRGYREIFVTFLLKSILSFILFKRVREFNGQPKIMPIKSIKDIDSLPNDYTFDLNLYHLCSDHNIIYLQNIQYNRECGKSSWSALNSLGILISYIKKGLYLKYGD